MSVAFFYALKEARSYPVSRPLALERTESQPDRLTYHPQGAKIQLLVASTDQI